jgi:23S rRNA pseudouridine1911/1915/1917 synthase
MNSTKTVTIDNTNSGNRLDIFVSEAFPNISRSSIQNQIKKGLITVNNEAVKPSYILKNGDTILCDFDFPATNQINVLSNYDIPLDIIFEDSDIIVLNKPAGISVHTSENEKEKTLVNALVNYYPEIAKDKTPSSIEKNISRHGIVHRLDKYTTGDMDVSKKLKEIE